ncbi:MAG: 1-deoxy-D-xylulose-5-phosphate synthase [Coriobacteriia bacterium]|nr:1-deoxy-D-xylulose-5-phosphate synthase [Coriobacteriia bacterium]
MGNNSANTFNIPDPDELKQMGFSQLAELAALIRRRIIQVTSISGGHLASSLGAVELIIALHRAYDLPVDRLVFDVGHQAYAHKLLTPREQDFETLRSFEGISGFTRREESVFDAHDSGHASDSLSIALGLALARDLNQTDERIVALIGDAALSGGLAFEALNQIGQLQTDLTIVLNDNEMSISHNVGALSLHLGKARMSRAYTTLRDTVEGRMASTGRLGRFLVNAGETAKGSFKKLVVPGTFFEDMGIVYIGPIDGHDIETISEALQASKKSKGPVLIHAVTQKGRGYAPAEMQPERFHGVSCYDPRTGRFNGKKSHNPSYTEVFSKALLAEATARDNLVAITAAMGDGTGLTAFSETFPHRFFDVGIAEEHAVALAGGLSLGGKLPVVAIYSSFLQRAYDQLMINVALQDAHVVFCVDRAGVVGEDGTTHHGLFDLAYLRTVPKMRLLAPADAQQLRDALHTALVLDDGPVALRYPRGSVPDQADDATRAATDTDPQLLPVGKAIKLRDGAQASILAVGRMVKTALDAAGLLAEQGIEASVYNMLWVKPLDEEAVAQAALAPLLVTLEEGTVVGGFGSAVLEELARQGSAPATATAQSQPRVLTLGIPDDFVKHGSVEELLRELGLTASQIAERIRDVLQGQGQTD